MEKNEYGKLWIVGTPIGNRGDITLRALQTLKDADVIACEDTRHSAPFLNGYDIKKPLISYHKFNENVCADKITERLARGENVALITDAGMPCVSDPGAILVNKVREAGYTVTTAPGATALTTAVALAGIRGAFTFIGFLPEKRKDRISLVTSFSSVPCALVFYMSPHDIQDDLLFLYEILGERKVSIVRELTKIYEEVTQGVLGQIEVPQPRGEYVVIVHEPQTTQPQGSIEEQLRELLASGVDRKSAVKKVAADNKVNRDTVYKAALGLQDDEN